MLQLPDHAYTLRTICCSFVESAMPIDYCTNWLSSQASYSCKHLWLRGGCRCWMDLTCLSCHVYSLSLSGCPLC
jgi:hypothetical protein